MKPLFKQTRPEVAANIPVATKARQVEAWLESLPLGDASASARLLVDYLRAHDRAEVALSLRRQMLEPVAVAMRRVLNTLGTGFRDMPLPMDARQLDCVDQALRLLAAAGDFCKRLIIEQAERSPPLFGSDPLPAALGRFLHVQREVMELCHISHRQLPEGYWQDCHQAGLMLMEAKLSASVDPVRPTSTLGELYLAILLEAVADPYHLSEQERIWTLDIIGRYGTLATVGAVRAASGIFGIRGHEDKPPFPLSWQADISPNCDLVLETSPLVRKLALIVSQLDRDEVSPQAVPLVRHPAYRELLQRLKLTWGGASQRTTARHRPAKPSQRTTVVGFYPTYRLLSGSLGESEKHAVVQCQMANESLGGMALMVAKPTFRLKIGSLVCVGRGGDDAWQDVGLVRWFKTGGNGNLTFGIKYLYGKMRPCLWSRMGDEQTYPGLLADVDHGQPKAVRHLVTPLLRLDPGAQLIVQQDGNRFALKLAGKSESFPEVEVFRCAP